MPNLVVGVILVFALKPINLVQYTEKMKRRSNDIGSNSGKNMEQNFGDINRLMEESRTARYLLFHFMSLIFIENINSSRKTPYEKIHKEVGPLVKRTLKEVRNLLYLDKNRQVITYFYLSKFIILLSLPGVFHRTRSGDKNQSRTNG